MSGHSKWSSIKHQKGAADAKRGKAFTKLAHAVTVAVRQGGKDPSMNPRLSLAIEMAKKANMPKDNIDRAIKRATGDLGGAVAEEVTYEGYGPGGTAIYIEAVTDNRNRTSSEVRSTLTKYGGKLGESGSVAYLFQQRGVIEANKGDRLSEKVELIIMDSGANDYEEGEESFIIYTEPRAVEHVKQYLEQSGLDVMRAEQRFEPSQPIAITDKKTASQVLKLMDALEELDDVSAVTSNFDLSDAMMQQLRGEV